MNVADIRLVVVYGAPESMNELHQVTLQSFYCNYNVNFQFSCLDKLGEEG